MSKLAIQADIESTDVLFEYKGAEIEQPLRDLRAHLLAEADRLSKTLSPESAKKQVPGIAGLITKDHDAETRQKIKLARSDAFEAQLWAAEAKRRPEHVWRLRMSQVKWLYRQHAPE